MYEGRHKARMLEKWGLNRTPFGEALDVKPGKTLVSASLRATLHLICIECGW